MPFGGVRSLAQTNVTGPILADGSHQCPSAEWLHWPAKATGKPYTMHTVSPMPFGGVPSLAYRSAQVAECHNRQVTNAFRRSAFTGPYMKPRRACWRHCSHQCLSAECLHWPQYNTMGLAVNFSVSPMPFGWGGLHRPGSPILQCRGYLVTNAFRLGGGDTDFTQWGTRGFETSKSPMPFGWGTDPGFHAGRHSVKGVTNAFRRSAFTGLPVNSPDLDRRSEVTNAFRRSAFTGPTSTEKTLCKPSSHQCLSAECLHWTKSGLAGFRLGCFPSPMPFGGVPSLDECKWRDSEGKMQMSPMPFGGVPSLATATKSGRLITTATSHQCLSAECLHWTRPVGREGHRNAVRVTNAFRRSAFTGPGAGNH